MKQMLPRSTGADVPDVRRFGVEVRGDGCVSQSLASHTTNLDHVGLGEFGEVRGFTAMRTLAVGRSPRVPLVLELSDIFQIRDGVVVTSAVNVIDVVTGRAFADEGLCDQPMNEPQFTAAVGRDTDAAVAPAVIDGTDYLAFDVSHSADIADFVMAVPSWQRLPDFVHD